MDEIELEENDGQDDFEQNFKGIESNESGKGESRTSFTDKNKDGNEEDEVNVDEDEEDEGKKNTVHKPNITVKVTNTKSSKLVQPTTSNLIPDEHLYDF